MHYRSVGLVVGLLWAVFLSNSWAQDPVTDYPIDSRIRLTGILQLDKQPQTSEYPLLSVWFGEKNGQFQITRVEPLIPEYPAEYQLRQISGLGLRLVAEKEVLAALQSSQMQGHPIVIEGRLLVQQGSLDISSVQEAVSASPSAPGK